MEEQLFLYRMYTNRIDWSLFSEFEYTNRDTSESEYLEKFYIKNFKNGEKFLYPHGRHLTITVNPVKLLKDFEVDKNGSEEYDIMYHTLYGDITIIYDLANGYDVTGYGSMFYAKNILEKEFPGGYYTPSTLLGPNIVESLPGFSGIEYSEN